MKNYFSAVIFFCVVLIGLFQFLPRNTYSGDAGLCPDGSHPSESSRSGCIYGAATGFTYNLHSFPLKGEVSIGSVYGSESIDIPRWDLVCSIRGSNDVASIQNCLLDKMSKISEFCIYLNNVVGKNLNLLSKVVDLNQPYFLFITDDGKKVYYYNQKIEYLDGGLVSFSVSKFGRCYRSDNVTFSIGGI